MNISIRKPDIQLLGMARITENATLMYRLIQPKHADTTPWKNFPHYWLYVMWTSCLRWILLTKPGFDFFYCYQCAQAVEQTAKLSVSSDLDGHMISR